MRRDEQEFATKLIQRQGIWVHALASSQDWMNWKETYFGDVYKFSRRPERPNEVIVDVGASMGCFAKLAMRCHPQARIVCIEACCENIPVLQANVGSKATVVHAACTYEKDPFLLNAAYRGCVNTGGSTVVPSDHPTTGLDRQYHVDRRPLPTITLEEVFERFGLDRIDYLKLDCEGSEFSILSNTTSLDRIDEIFGEWHGRERFMELVEQKLAPAGFDLTIVQDGSPFGIFRLTRGAT